LDSRIYLLAAVAFVVGIVELIIGGILDLVALDLGVSIGRAGLLITVFALVLGLSGPLLLYVTGRADRKRVILAALVIFIAGKLIAVASTTYGMLMLSRIISAASGGLLTVLCLTLAAQISEPSHRGRAIGAVVMGISAAIVLGLPVGISMGHAFGWRSPFVLVALLTLFLIAGVVAFFGKVAIRPPVSLRRQLSALRDRRVLAAQLTTFFFLAGHFTLYGYLTPFVITTMGFGGQLITLVYFLYGAAAVTGGGLAGLSTDKFGAGRTLIAAILLLFLCLLVIPQTTGVPEFFWIILVVWGVLSWAISPPIQSHLVALSPETADIQQSLNFASLHLGIALGTFVGGVVVDRASVEQTAVVGAFLILISLGTALLSLGRKAKPLSGRGS